MRSAMSLDFNNSLYRAMASLMRTWWTHMKIGTGVWLRAELHLHPRWVTKLKSGPDELTVGFCLVLQLYMIGPEAGV